MDMSYDAVVQMMNDFLHSQTETTPYPVTVLDRPFVVHPGVFSPRYYPDTEFFARVLPLRRGESFLEIGCGTGAICVLMRLLHEAQVTGVDINPQAVENARENVAEYRLTDEVTIVEGSLFEPLHAEDEFDCIFWNVPFGFIRETDLDWSQRAIFDPGYDSIRRFVAEARRHLRRGGRVFIGFSTTLGRLNELQAIVAANHASLRAQAAQETTDNDFELKTELFELVYE
ncbi:MAG: methyltransferase domain-containing protein [Myxococcales bacterium]|nr:MAG: methyltransferase domain-containing protein [Myxococcales bacterium]